MLRAVAHFAVLAFLSSPVLGQAPTLAIPLVDSTAERVVHPAELAAPSIIGPVAHSAGETVTYVLEARARSVFLVAVEQRGLDFVVAVETPSGDVYEHDSPLFRDEPELVLIDAVAGGSYRIAIRAEEPTHAAGAHSLELEAIEPDTDTRRLEAWRLMSDAAQANRETRGDDALVRYEKAAELWRALGETRREAQALFSAAMVRYWLLYDWSGAADQAKAAAALYDGLGERGLYANAMLAVGYSLMEVAQTAGAEAPRVFDDALAALGASRAAHESLGNAFGLAHVENFTGLAYFNRGQAETHDYAQALAHYRRSAELFAELGEWREELNVRMNAVLIDVDEGYAARAARALEGILADIPDGGDLLLRGIVLANLGVAYRDSGQYDAALRALTEAVKIHAELDQFNWEGLALRVLGTTYQALGELDRAREYLQLALEKSGDDGRVRSSVLAALGNVAYLSADYAEALDWHRRAVESTASAADRASRQAFVLRDLVALQRFDEAVSAGNAVLSVTAIPPVTRADAMVQLGHAYLGLGDHGEADARFRTALGIYDASGLVAEQARALHGRTLAARAAGDLDSAIRWGQESLRRIESLRTNVAAPELRAFYSAANRSYYDTQTELLIEAYEATGAAELLRESLTVSERSRARMILDLLEEASIRLERGVPQATLDRERTLYEDLAALRQRRDTVLQAPEPDTHRLRSIVSRMTAVEHELSVLSTEARRKQGASMAAAAPLGAAELQATLDDGVVLLQYSLGETRSLAWIVTRASIDVVTLAPRAVVEDVARRAHAQLKTLPSGRNDGRALAELSGLVLEPLAGRLAEARRVIVVADGALAYIPFGALPLEREGGAVPLLEAVDVVHAPSISALAAQKRRAEPARPSKTLAIFADPVFAATDARLAHDVSSPAAQRAPTGTGLGRLPATGVEARAIAALVRDDLELVATGFDASRERVLHAPLADYRIVHFATHGLVDSRYPGLSALALSHFDAAGMPQDGLLRLPDIYGMRLNADLVVLSGCDTALGREIRGEGLVGLVDAFLYAGARNLLVSLWQVPDRATAELMSRFYSHVLTDPLDPADALRRAQRSIAAERRWSDPYYWGAFVLLGGV